MKSKIIKNYNLIQSATQKRYHFCGGYAQTKSPCYGDQGSGVMRYGNEHWIFTGVVSEVGSCEDDAVKPGFMDNFNN